MPPKRKAPTAKEIERLIEEHGSVKAAAEAIGYDPQSLYNRRDALSKRIPENNRQAWRWAPWWVANEHTNSPAGRMVRAMHGIRIGNKRVSDFVMDGARRQIARMQSNDSVISYHPEAPENRFGTKGGFFIRPRSPDDLPGLMQPCDPNSEPPTAEQLKEWSDLFY